MKQFRDSILIKRVWSECIVDDYVIGKTNNKGEHFIEDESWQFFYKRVNDKINRVDSDLRYYGKLLFWSGDYDNVIKFFRWAELVFPDEWTYNFHASQYLLFLNRPEEALSEAIKANKKAPWRETTYKLLSRCYDMLNKKELSSNCLQLYESKKLEKERLYSLCKNL